MFILNTLQLPQAKQYRCECNSEIVDKISRPVKISPVVSVAANICDNLQHSLSLCDLSKDLGRKEDGVN